MTDRRRPTARLTSLEFTNFKAFPHFSVALQPVNILVGPNNSGKSTVVGALRVLDVALRRAAARRPERLAGVPGTPVGYPLSPATLPISLANVATDYSDEDATIRFRLSNGSSLRLVFSPSVGPYLLADSSRGVPSTTSAFREAVPLTITAIPHLGPLENPELLVEEKTVRENLQTHRASRHFRNYWHHYPEGFSDFAALVARTWPTMEIEKPELVAGSPMSLAMYCREKRVTRELFWSGVGFQIWCQLLTHISRGDAASLIVLDEPEIYLHPDMQRQLLALLRRSGPDVVLATHSSEIMAESDPEELLLVDKTRRSARRVRDIEGVQAALTSVGSVQNVTLAQLARTRKVLFTEGQEDYRILRRFAAILGYDDLAAGLSLTAVESDGFASWKRIRDFAWGLSKTVGDALRIAAVFDRDYHCEEELTSVKDELAPHVALVSILARKEIENYLLVPTVLQRAIDKASAESGREEQAAPAEAIDIVSLLRTLLATVKSETQGQLVARRLEQFRHSRRDSSALTREALDQFERSWATIEGRLIVAPGKEILRLLRDRLAALGAPSLSNARILNSFRPADVPDDMRTLIATLDEFARQGPS